MRKALQLVCALLAAALAAWFGRGAVYELFVFEPGVHYPRVTFSPASAFRPDTPTFSAAVILICSALAFAGAAAVVVVIISRRPGRATRRYWVLQGLAFGAAASAWLVAASDFLGHAGEFG